MEKDAVKQCLRHHLALKTISTELLFVDCFLILIPHLLLIRKCLVTATILKL